MVKITVLPNQQTFQANWGENLFRALTRQGLEMNGYCGGKGTCGKCKVLLVDGTVQGEVSADHTCLACKTELVGDLTIDITTSEDVSWRKSSLFEDVQVPLRPEVSKIFIDLPQPSITDQLADWERLLTHLPKQRLRKPSLGFLRQLPNLLREANYQVTAVMTEEEVIALEKGDTTSQAYGVAFDIGTTSIVGFLLDLNQGKTVRVRSIGNPQRVIGADVISRIEYVNSNPKGSSILREKVVAALNELVDELLQATGVKREFLYQVNVVGNTTMHHLLLGINPYSLAQAPFIPALKTSLILSAQELGLNLSPAAKAFILPNIAGFIGSDTVGAILASGLDRATKPQLMIDIGTNGEVALGCKDRIVACSTAAGPAFEGAQIRFGMRATVGAIEGVTISDSGVQCKVIGGAGVVKGICGSGLIQAVAQMLAQGIVSPTGRLLDAEAAEQTLSPDLAERVRRIEDQNVFILIPEDESTGQLAVYITQTDIRELQLAKAAIAAGIGILLKEMNLAINDIDQVFLAGAFGSYIDRESAKIIGLIPQVSLEQVESIGNAAGAGAVMALVSIDARLGAERIANQVTNIELSSRPDFQTAFVEAMVF